ncbi:MAG TPA: sn-glycerol-3-phosphate ABC transporter ATP-binding protein UgpC [Gaiellaceae bacterium]
MERPTDSASSGAAAKASKKAAGIRLENVTKVYLGDTKAVDDVSFEIADGEFMVLVGPSGCGKSTLLRVIAGLETVTAGRVLIGEDDVTDVRPQNRDLAMVFQNYALYPHMTVAGNLAFGLRLRHIDKADRERRVRDVARTLGLDELLERKPGELSGGQRQRVAMGRAMVREPRAFLMDEPLSNLDAKLRVTMRAELARLHERLGVTTVYVTHDQIEAMTLGQRVAVLRDGVLQQVDTAQRLFREPANLFVAAFIGSPSMNLVEADIADGRLRFAGYELPLPDGLRLTERRVILGIRPTDFQDSAVADPSLPRLHVRAAVVEDLGAESHVLFPIDAPRVVAEAVRAAEVATEPTESLLADDNRALFTARIDGQHFVSPGEELDLAVDPRRMHFFDPTTGTVLGR